MRLVSKSIIALAVLTFVAPVLTFAADIPGGRREYERNCVMCHGTTGRGNGWLTGFLRQPIPSLTQLKKNNGGVFPVERVRQVIDGRKPVGLHGPRDMPIWGQVFLTKAQREHGPSHGPYDDDKVVQARILSLIDYISMLQE